MNTRKVKPASEKRAEFEHVSGCFKYFFIFSVKFLFWTGLMPMKYSGKDKMFEFKLFSVSSYFSFFQLSFATFPALVLPHYLAYGGTCEDEYKKGTGEKYDMKFLSGLNELREAEFYMNFLIYVLPFALVFTGIEYFSTLYNCQMDSTC